MHRRPAPTYASRSPSHAPALAALLVANLALAFGPWFVRLAGADGGVGPVAAGFWRVALAAPLLAALALAGGARPVALDRRLTLALLAGGVCFAVDLATWHAGILRTTLANATLFGNCATLIFPVYGFLVARTWPTHRQWLALALAAAGGALLIGRSYSLAAENLLGDALCLLAGVMYAAYFILMARVRAVMRPLPALTLSSSASVLPLLLFALALGERIRPADWSALVALALLSQVLGQGCMVYALGRLSPLVIGLALLIQPAVAAALGWTMYGERLGPADATGIALVAAALVLVRPPRPVASARRTADMAGQEAA